MRLFVALEAPEAWRSAAAEVQAEVARALPEEARRALRPVSPELMHLTLRFLGEVEDGRVERLQAALDREVPPVALELALGRAGTFGVPPRTSVVWLGIEGDRAGLDRLAARIERAVHGVGLPAEERPFSPHLTLCRLRREASPAQRRAIADGVAALSPPDPAATRMRAGEVVLIRSHLGGAQPRYEVLSRHG